MELHIVNVVAGIPVEFHTRGGYFSLLKGTGIFEIETDTGIHSDYIAGIGSDLRGENGSFFSYVRLKADSDQTVQVMISQFPITDSRLIGDVDINGGHSRSYVEITIPPGVATLMLDDDTTRIGAAIVFNCVGRIGGDNTVSDTVGFPVQLDGQINDNNTSELWMYSAGGGSVYVLGDIR